MGREVREAEGLGVKDVLGGERDEMTKVVAEMAWWRIW